MTRYTLTEKVKKILEARGYNLICKICECPLLIGEDIESKQQRRGKSKLYHGGCYDGSEREVEVKPDEMTDKELEDFFNKPREEVTKEELERFFSRHKKMSGKVKKKHQKRTKRKRKARRARSK